MAVVQLALPLALAWTTVLIVQRQLSGANLVLAVWPTQWPILAQLFIKIAIGDFFRYWLHRTAHVWPPLWRLHAVHHEPTKLYTWWSYRSPDWKTADKGRRLDHIWVAPALADRVSGLQVQKHARGWLRPSDHVPVTATLEV